MYFLVPLIFSHRHPLWLQMHWCTYLIFNSWKFIMGCIFVSFFCLLAWQPSVVLAHWAGQGVPCDMECQPLSSWACSHTLASVKQTLDIPKFYLSISQAHDPLSIPHCSPDRALLTKFCLDTRPFNLEIHTDRCSVLELHVSSMCHALKCFWRGTQKTAVHQWSWHY